MHPAEITWYKVIVLLAAALTIGFGIVNIVYFNNIRLRDNCQEISTSEATTLLWFNIVMVIFASIAFLWSLYRLVFSGEPTTEKVKENHLTHFYDETPNNMFYLD